MPILRPLVLTRRRFFQTLAASALAAKVPLPIGFPDETITLTATEVLERKTVFLKSLNNVIIDEYFLYLFDINFRTLTKARLPNLTNKVE